MGANHQRRPGLQLLNKTGSPKIGPIARRTAGAYQFKLDVHKAVRARWPRAPMKLLSTHLYYPHQRASSSSSGWPYEHSAACSHRVPRRPGDDWRTGLLPLQRRQPLSAVRETGGASVHARRRGRHPVRRLGAGRRARLRHGRLQRLEQAQRASSIPRANSGIWEGFVPASGPAPVYKYHIVSRYNGY